MNLAELSSRFMHWFAETSVNMSKICGVAELCETICPKEGNLLFNDPLNTFYLRVYGVGNMVKDHSDS